MKMKRFTPALILSTAFLAGAVEAADIQLPASSLKIERVIPMQEALQRGMKVVRAAPAAPVAPMAVDPLAIYSNVTTFSGSALGQATATGGITRLFMDDVTFTTNAGVSNVTTIRFSVANLNATDQSVRARVRFWRADGAGGGPGTYYDDGVAGNIGYTFNPFTFTGNSIIILSGNVGTGFAVPAGATTTLWAGITFDNVGTTTGATDVELDNFGQGFFDPVDLGSSTDTIFATTAAGSFFGTSNPAGATTNFGGTPVANYGWEFVVTTLPAELTNFTIE